MKELAKLGEALSKSEQRKVNGGRGPRCVPVNGYCSPQTKANGKLIDSEGNFISCCFLAEEVNSGPCSHPC